MINIRKLEAELWDSADLLRAGSKLTSNQYCMFDLLFKADLSKQEITEIKKVAVDLLAKVKTKIAELDHWADKPETKAIVDNLIRDTLWAELPESYDEISITTYRKEIYEYIYLRYKTAA